MGQAPVPVLELAGRGHVEAIVNQEVAHIPGEVLGALECEFRFGRGVPQVGAGRGALEGVTVHLRAGVKTEGRQIILPEVFRLVVADNHQDVRVPLVQPVVKDVKGSHHLLLVADVLAQPIVLSEFLQQLGRGFVVGNAGEYPVPAFGPHLRRGQDYGPVGAAQPQ